MSVSSRFHDKIRAGKPCFGTAVTFSDATVTEALCEVLDFVWIDTEHNPLSLEAVQGHVMAAKGTGTTVIVRVPWNDPTLVKPVLDIGALGIIVPMVKTVDDVRLAVQSCLYPPQGVRGYGPRRATSYGRIGSAEYCRQANESVMPIVMIEQKEAVENIEDILAVEGLAGVAIGPMDLAGSMGYAGHPGTPAVVEAVQHVIDKTRETDRFVGIGASEDADVLTDLFKRGVQWSLSGNDYNLMIRWADSVMREVEANLAAAES